MAVAAGKAATAAVHGDRARAAAAGGQPPDLEEMLKRGQDKVKQVMHGGGIPGPLLLLVGAIAVAVIVWQAFFFRVNPDELGVVLRFGEFIRTAPPGLHPRWPYPIEEVRLPKVTRQNIIEIGMRSPSGGRLGGSARDERAESLMLTGDENIVDIDFVVYLAHQGRGEVPVQHPEPGHHREGGGRERHARGRRPVQDPADPHAGAAEDRGGGAEADAEDARQLRRRHPHRPGAAAEGRSSRRGHRCLPRRAGGARRQGTAAERGLRLRQQGGA